jgi:uncharacterized membrane protein
MFPILYFILGILFIQIVLPILTSITDLYLTKIEVKKLEMSVKASEYNNKIAYGEAPPAPYIGFTYTP